MVVTIAWRPSHRRMGFLDLPREIRDMVYNLILSNEGPVMMGLCRVTPEKIIHFTNAKQEPGFRGFDNHP